MKPVDDRKKMSIYKNGQLCIFLPKDDELSSDLDITKLSNTIIKERIHSGLNNKISSNKINNINVPKNCLQ